MFVVRATMTVASTQTEEVKDEAQVELEEALEKESDDRTIHDDKF